MPQVLGDTIAEFWSFLQTAFGAALPWVIVLVGITSIALLFRGRIAARWLFPLVLIAAAAWAIHRWLWFYF
jgi:glucose dehydrogenase